MEIVINGLRYDVDKMECVSRFYTYKNCSEFLNILYRSKRNNWLRLMRNTDTLAVVPEAITEPQARNLIWRLDRKNFEKTFKGLEEA